MTNETGTIQLPGVTLARSRYGRPKRPVEDSVLIIYSVAATDPEQKSAVIDAVNSYRRRDIREDRLPDSDRFVQTRAKVFEIPKGASPGAALGTELLNDLKCCLGAIAFVDDLRPNIAYELGFFHGKGAPVLLLTARAPGRSWRRLSDLAGAALAKTAGGDITKLVHQYLDRLFIDLEKVDPWPTYSLPKSQNNLLAREDVEIRGERYEVDEEGPFGRLLRISFWDYPVNVVLNGSLSPDARFKVALRSTAEAHYAMYFEIAFQDSQRKDRQVWLGLSSWLTTADFRNDERNLPSDPANKQWRYITGTFAGLLRQGHLLQVRNVSIKRLRFRAGEPHSEQASPVEIGYVDIIGLL